MITNIYIIQLLIRKVKVTLYIIFSIVFINTNQKSFSLNKKIENVSVKIMNKNDAKTVWRLAIPVPDISSHIVFPIKSAV